MTLISEIGSSTTAPALAMASLKPSEPAILKLISERVDGVVLAVEALDADVDDGEAVDAAVAHRLLDALLDRGDELAGDRPADDLVDELEAGPAVEGLDPQPRHAELAVAAGLLLVLALGLGLAGDGLAVGDPDVLGVDVARRTCAARRSRATARCVSPVPCSSVWWVSSLRSSTSAGSSSWQPLEGRAQLVVVGLGAGLDGDGEDRRAAARPAARARACPWAPACRRCRCWPAWPPRRCRRPRTSVTGTCSLPRRWNRPWRRSSAPVRGFTSCSSAFTVPDSTLNSESWPTYGSAIVLNTKASGWPPASGGDLGLGVAGE